MFRKLSGKFIFTFFKEIPTSQFKCHNLSAHLKLVKVKLTLFKQESPSLKQVVISSSSGFDSYDKESQRVFLATDIVVLSYSPANTASFIFSSDQYACRGTEIGGQVNPHQRDILSKEAAAFIGCYPGTI